MERFRVVDAAEQRCHIVSLDCCSPAPMVGIYCDRERIGSIVLDAQGHGLIVIDKGALRRIGYTLETEDLG